MTEEYQEEPYAETGETRKLVPPAPEVGYEHEYPADSGTPYAPPPAYTPPYIHQLPQRQRGSSIWSGVHLPSLIVSILVIVALLAALTFGGWIYQRFFAIGTPQVVTVQDQPVLPQVQPGTADMGEFWNGRIDWLPINENVELRSRENVVNLAFLELGGGVRYSRMSLLTIDEEAGWEIARKPIGLKYVLRDGVVRLEVQGNTYTLNPLQPFVLEYDPGLVYVIMQDGQLYSTTQVDKLVPADDASEQVILPPNPNLSL